MFFFFPIQNQLKFSSKGKTNGAGEGRCRLLERLDPVCFELTFNLACPGHPEPEGLWPLELSSQLSGWMGSLLGISTEQGRDTQPPSHNTTPLPLYGVMTSCRCTESSAMLIPVVGRRTLLLVFFEEGIQQVVKNNRSIY